MTVGAEALWAASRCLSLAANQGCVIDELPEALSTSLGLTSCITRSLDATPACKSLSTASRCLSLAANRGCVIAELPGALSTCLGQRSCIMREFGAKSPSTASRCPSLAANQGCITAELAEALSTSPGLTSCVVHLVSCTDLEVKDVGGGAASRKETGGETVPARAGWSLTPVWLWLQSSCGLGDGSRTAASLESGSLSNSSLAPRSHSMTCSLAVERPGML